MPIYTYECKQCGAEFDLLIGMTSEKTELKCVKCGSNNITKQLGTFNVGNSNSGSGFSGGSCPSGVCGL